MRCQLSLALAVTAASFMSSIGYCQNSSSEAQFERAILNLESGSRHPGKIEWYLARIPVEPGKKHSELNIVLDIRFEQPKCELRSLLTWTKLESGPALVLDAEFAACEVGSEPANLPGLLILEREGLRGKAPKGLIPVKLTKSRFLVGVPIEDDNLELLKSANWISLPVLLQDGKRMIIEIETGASGRAVITEAMTKWGL